MSLFSKFKKEKPTADWSQAHAAEPKFYRGPDGAPFGAIALTEGTEIVELAPVPVTIEQGDKTSYLLLGCLSAKIRIESIKITKV